MSHKPSDVDAQRHRQPLAIKNTMSNIPTLSPSINKTPKKRAVPLEDVHARNTVPGHQSPSPNKRSKSSKDGSSANDPSTSNSIALGLGDVQLQSRAILPPSRSRQTTARIDKNSRLTENDRQHRERQKVESTKEWRKKFIKAFPNFRFHLDGLDEVTRKEVTAVIEQLGGSIEPFFSSTVTHIVTSRKVGVSDASVALALPVLPSAAESSRVIAPAASVRPVALRFARRKAAAPLHSDRNPFEERGPALPANDILNKARHAGMKVWPLDKFRNVIISLIGEEVVTDPKKQPNFAHLLEKVPSIMERDAMAARDNYHYFSKNTAYILIEDATGEHRPIMYQEWKKPAEGDPLPWPVLYGQLEGRCPFTKFDFDGDLRKRMKPNRHETLKRSVSLSHLNRSGLANSPVPSGDSRGGYSINRGASPYPLASGNSVSLTSNIASTTSTAMTGPSGLGLIPPYGAGALGRKVNQTSTIGLGRPSSIPSNARSSHSHTSTAQGATTAVNDPARGSLVRRMLGMTEQNHHSHLSMVRRSVSTASAGQQMRREKKPGYCENCRSKYDDFDEHIAGRKHRKFAQDDSQFADIDALLSRVRRPIAPWAMSSASERGSSTDVDASSHSSLLAAGGSLLEVEGAEEEEEDDSEERLPHLHSPRGFMDTMHQWQQSTQLTDQQVVTPLISSPYSRRSASILPYIPEAINVDDEESISSHGCRTNAGDTTATTMDHQTEEDIVSQSPDTSPHIHHQYQHHHQHSHLDKDQGKQEQDDSYTASYYGTAF